MAKVAIVGTGLIGTSLALALRQSHLKNLEVVGTDYDHSARGGAHKRGAFHKVENRLSSAVRDADIVIMAIPVMGMRDLLETLGPNLEEGCVVTDVGSSKKVVLEWADEFLPHSVDFVGGHPMAGKEASGPEAAEASLFRDKAYCIVPSTRARQAAVSEITTLAEAVGARPFFIGVDEHDSFVAAASHLPFLLSVALVGCTSKSPNWEDIAQLAASGYTDVSRLASGDPVMHRDICVSNPGPIVAWIDAFIRELHDVRQLLDGEGGAKEDEVHKVFEQAFVARSMWQSGAMHPLVRRAGSHSDIPSFAETMGDMFMGRLGRRGLEAQKRLFNDTDGSGRKKK